MTEIDLAGDGLGKVWIHRKIMDSEVWVIPELLKVFLWCVLRANYKDTYVSIKAGKGQNTILALRGTFIFGRKSAAEKLNMPESSVRNHMKRLQDMDVIKVTPSQDNLYSIVTVLNYNEYQSEKKKSGQPKDSLRTALGQPQDTDNKDKKDEKDNKLKLYTQEAEESKLKLYSSDFLEFWKLWKSIDHPGRSDKRRTSEKYRSLSLKGVSPSTILDELKRYIDAEAPRLRERARRAGESKETQFIPNAGKWLNRFNDGAPEEVKPKKDYLDELVDRGAITPEEALIKRKQLKEARQ